MHSLVVFILCIFSLYPNVWGQPLGNISHESALKKNDDDLSEIPMNNLTTIGESYGNASESRVEESNLESSSELLINENSSQTERSKSAFTSSQSPTSQKTPTEVMLTEMSGSSTGSLPASTTPVSTTRVSGGTTSTEPEEVVQGEPSSTTTTQQPPDTFYQKTLALINDTYTWSILVPIAAGIVFASTILVTVATCRSLRKRCRRRKLHKKFLPDSVKNLRPSDRAKLLAESSDEEF